MVFYTKIGDSEVRHDFHDDGFTITGSHTILHQKLLFQPRKSGVTLPQVTAKSDPPEASRWNPISLLNAEKIKISRNKKVNFSALHSKYTRIVSLDSSDSADSNNTKNSKIWCLLGVRVSN